MRQERGNSNVWGMAFCVGVSLLLHAGVAYLLPEPSPKDMADTRPQGESREVRLHLAPEPEAEEPDPIHPFAKTDADLAERLPERTDYEGERNARAASDSPALAADEETPAMTGEEKEELVTFNQDRQDGDVQHHGRETEEAAQDIPPAPPVEPESPVDPAEPEEPEPPAEVTGPVKPETPEAEEAGAAPAPASPPPVPATPPPPPPSRPVIHRDPSLADHAQPGFRETERRSRSVGRFVMGHHASLNVSATPRGRYEAEIYHRIAQHWYRECDEHRGDIIPGKIVVSIRLDRHGRLVNMALIQRSGASVIQQSFTFGAIRQASLPPMPENVQSEMVGDLMELIFEFNFN